MSSTRSGKGEWAETTIIRGPTVVIPTTDRKGIGVSNYAKSYTVETSIKYETSVVVISVYFLVFVGLLFLLFICARYVTFDL